MPPERLRVRQIVGASRSDTSRSLSTEAKSPVFISISTQHGYRGRWAFATSLRRHRLQRSPGKTGWDCRFQFSVRIESQNTLALHAVFCGHLCDFYHARNAPLQNEHESRANLWKHFEAATGMPFGYIAWPRLWACSLLQNSFRGCAAPSTCTAPNSITPMTSAVFSAAAGSRFDAKETVKTTAPAAARKWASKAWKFVVFRLKVVYGIRSGRKRPYRDHSRRHRDAQRQAGLGADDPGRNAPSTWLSSLASAAADT